MKTMKKAILALLTVCVLSVCMILCAANVSAAEVIDSGACGDKVTWTLYNDGELVIDGTGDMWDYTAKTTAPWYTYRKDILSATVKNGVTSIGSYGFYYCQSITKISLPDGLISVGENAFGTSGVKEIEIPASTIEIGDLAFHKCESLNCINVAEENPAFADVDGVLFNKSKTTLIKYPVAKADTKYIIPAGVTCVYDSSFFGCRYLNVVVFADDVKSIGMNAFVGCSKLNYIHITKNIDSIGQRAFAQMNSLTSFSVDKENSSFSVDDYGVLFNKDQTKLIRYPIGNKTTGYSVPAATETIGGWAFENAFCLEKVVMPENVKSFEKSAFSGCSNLKIATVYNRNAEFRDYVFNSTHESFMLYGYLGSTTEAYAAANGHTFSSLAEPARELIASGKCGDNLSWGLYNDGELAIGGDGEMWNYTLKEAAPWNGYVSQITKITVKNGVTTIGSYAFYKCTKAASISIAEGVTEIGKEAFGHCYNLKTITIPASVISIEIFKEPFDGCRSLTDIHVAAGNQYYSSLDGVLYDISKTTLIKYPNGKPGVKYGFPESVKSLGDYSFFGNNYLEKVIIPESVSYIGQWAFSASNITSVSIGPNVSSIGSRAFANCHNLKYVSVDEQNPWFSGNGNGILFNKDQTKLIQYPAAREISSYTVPDTVTEIGGWAFESAAYLEKVQLPENVARIEKSAFLGCGNLKKATVYNSNAIFADFVFSSTNESFELWGYAGSTAEAYATKNGHNFMKLGVPELPIRDSGQCGDNLTWVLYGNGELVIDGTGEMWSWSFGTSPWYSHKNSIKTVTMNNGVTTIGDYAFYGLNNLVNVTIPEGVTSFGDSAFSFCLRLSSISIPKTVKTLGQGAIRACRELTTVTIPAGVTSISTYVFADSFKLESIIVDESNPNYCSEDGVLFNKDKTILIQYPAGKTDETYFVPKTVERIENGAFYGCRILASISIPKSVISIQPGVFSFCEALTSFVVDENNPCYSSDSDGVLYDKAKTKLMRYPAGKTEAAYTVSDSVSVIDLGSFDGCVYLESIKLPENVLSVYGHAFLGCQKLTSATILCPNAEIDDDVFRDVHSSFTIYGYSGSTAEEHAAKNGFNFVALGESNPVSLPGDINGDASVDISDAIDLFMHSMLPNQYPIAYSESVDFNKDGSVDIADAILLFMHSMLPNQYPLG